jgi:hypothetical protein
MLNPKVRPEHSDNIVRRRRQALKTDNPVGKRIAEALGDRTLKWLSSKTGISESTLGDYVKKGISRADYAVLIAKELDQTVEWLIAGRRAVGQLVEAEQADWVTISEYDLRELTDEGRGEPRFPSPFRRDWLNQTLGAATGLWLTRLLSDYSGAGLVEGTLVFCADVESVDLRDRERQLCLFRINGGLVVGRYSNLPIGSIAPGDELFVYSSQIGTEDNQYVPVARILGRFIGRL